MMFWLREIFGWALIGLGLYAFGVAYFDLVQKGFLVQAAPVIFIGFIIFRGGIHLIKVSIAIRISREAIRESKKGTNRSPVSYAPEKRTVVPGTASRN
jgi:hypothetical protein